MIYIFSHDLSFSDQLLTSFSEQEAQSFTDEIRLASILNETEPDGILFDLRSGMRPLKLIERVYHEKPSIIIVVILPAIGITEELGTVKELFWPVEAADVVAAFKEIRRDRILLESYGIIGRSDELIKAANTVKKVASSDVNVLITGPSGAGKEIIARAIHSGSKKPDSPFIAVNVAALAPGIIESELFGHERGAFTGATSRRIGAFEQASDGIIFLDEVAEIPLEIQAKLLRVLDQRSFTRVGGNNQIDANFRLLAATNKILQDEVSAGRFREDLFYRLSVVTIDLPSLNARKQDISPLAYHFLAQRGRELKSDNLSIEPGALRLFYHYEWPGNVRELKNVIDSFSVTSSSGRIRASDFEQYVRERRSRSELLPVITGRTSEAAEHQIMMQAIMALTNEVSSMRRLIEKELDRVNVTEGGFAESASSKFGPVRMEDAEKELVVRALNEAGGNRKKAARILGIGERTLYRKLDKYGLK
ncbi:MAG: sigma-54 dependent transcriptional regulator [candidate division Zixibacteria bacterium]